MNALLTDLYELTMAAGYFEAGKTAERAVWLRAFRPLIVHHSGTEAQRKKRNRTMLVHKPPSVLSVPCVPSSILSLAFPPCLRASVVNNPL